MPVRALDATWIRLGWLGCIERLDGGCFGSSCASGRYTGTGGVIMMRVSNPGTP